MAIDNGILLMVLMAMIATPMTTVGADGSIAGTVSELPSLTGKQTKRSPSTWRFASFVEHQAL
jgi:hypothetical protein